MTALQCPICDSSNNSRSDQLYDDRFGYPGIFDLYFCNDCEHRWLAFTPDAATLGDLYTNYYPRSRKILDDFTPLRAQQGLLCWWCGERSSASFWVPRNVRVLDVGCGFGESLAYHRARDCEVYGVEADLNILRVAERFGFQVHVGPFDSSQYQADFFDFVTLDQVAEHLADPIKTLKDIKGVLKPGGRLILTTPNANGFNVRLFGSRWIHWHAPYHLQFFSASSLENAARKAGLVIEKVRTVTSSEWINYQWIHLATCPPQGVKSVFWMTNIDRTFLQYTVIKGLRAFHRLGIDHLFTRLMDWFGVGDNFVIQLKKAE